MLWLRLIFSGRIISHDIETLIYMIESSFYLLVVAYLLTFVVCVQLIFTKSLLKTTIFMSAFSLLITIVYLLMDAPDVAMTEVALGACLSTCVLLNFIKSCTQEQSVPFHQMKRSRIFIAFVICTGLAIVLVWACLDLPDFGAVDSPLQIRVSEYYLKNTREEIGIPSFVAAILASYRGYDTLGETLVILIASLGVLLISSQMTSIKKDA
jgi:multicomponent Na+:H+ antiporter subunit B